jgi:hypothetical protein
MTNHPVPQEDGTSAIEVPRVQSGIAPRQGTPNLGREQLAYSKPEVVSWKHWPDPVLAELRRQKLAPFRLDTGTAGEPLTKRRSSGVYYRQRQGWYLGSDIQGREVFVRIAANQPLRQADPNVRRFAPNGEWSVQTSVWLLTKRKRRSWSNHVEAAGSGHGETRSQHERQIQSIPMPPLFIKCLIGVPSAFQEAVLLGAEFAQSPWGDARAWGYNRHTAPCYHDGACERVVLAVMERSTLVVMDAQRLSTGWNGFVVRSQAEQVDQDRPAVDSGSAS